MSSSSSSPLTAYIVEAVRTAGGRKGGRLSQFHPADLGAIVVDELVDRLKIDPAAVDDVIFGCVSQIGAQSANLARNVVLSSKLPESVPGVTVDRQCGSSQQVQQQQLLLHRWYLSLSPMSDKKKLLLFGFGPKRRFTLQHKR